MLADIFFMPSVALKIHLLRDLGKRLVQTLVDGVDVIIRHAAQFS
jgi:hypothetical protein